MKVVAVTRILNEDDILEAFARHHHKMFDHHVYLDNGSCDRSEYILRSLKDEKFPITLLKTKSSWSDEVNHLTILHRYAAIVLKADWVVHLDADEFLDTRSSEHNLGTRLATLPDSVYGLQLKVVQYPNLPIEDHGERVVPKRLRWKLINPQDDFKLVVRGGSLAEQTVIDAGSHKAWIKQELVNPLEENLFRLAHFPRRSPWQQISKFTIGRLKAIAAGKLVIDAMHGLHYVALLDLLKNQPGNIFNFPGFMDGSANEADVELDPLFYQGGNLQHTQEEDPRLKAVRCITAYVEELALQHGRLIDENTAVRALLQSWSSQVNLVF